MSDGVLGLPSLINVKLEKLYKVSIIFLEVYLAICYVIPVDNRINYSSISGLLCKL